MKNLNEEIKRSKKLMGISEGLNLIKLDTPVKFATHLIKKLVNKVEIDPDNENYLTYYDENEIVVMDYDKRNKWLSISNERIYNPIQYKFPILNCYERVAPVIRKSLENITEFEIPEIDYINNMSTIETKWYRK